MGADLTRLGAIVADLEAAAQSPEQLQVLDFDFFEELVHLTGNRVLMLLVNTIRQVYLEKPAVFAVLYQSATFDAAPHRRTLAAVVAGDADAAARAMEAHAAAARAVLGAAQLAAAKGETP